MLNIMGANVEVHHPLHEPQEVSEVDHAAIAEGRDLRQRGRTARDTHRITSGEVTSHCVARCAARCVARCVADRARRCTVRFTARCIRCYESQ